MTQLYRIEEFCTNGWVVIDEFAKQLSREECQRKLEDYIAEGYNPNYLRAVPDVN